jgi:hypothetical protein
MNNKRFNRIGKAFATMALAVLGLCRVGIGQQVSLALLRPEVATGLRSSSSPAAPAAPVATASFQTAVPPESTPHRFWDRENSLLFAANAGFSAADFVVTRNNLKNGGTELNPVTGLLSGSTAGLAANFAGETAGVVGLSYLFHKTGHHKLERLTSIVNLGSSAAAVSFGLAHR